jgi:hypothetical protein
VTDTATDTARSNVTRTMLLAAGIYFLVCALLYNTWLIAAAVEFVRTTLNRPWTTMPDPTDVRRMEMVYLAIGAVLTGTGLLIGARTGLDRAFRRGWVATIVLSFLAFLVPVATLEVALRPLTPELGKVTSLFTRDAELEWKMRPNATQSWGGIQVTTNSLGFRGPEPASQPPPGTVRILHLGDSVAFGFMVKRWQDTFPFVVDSLLESDGMNVETLNTGVGGYSPWQELVVLRRQVEGFSPDVAVLNFVLNDVTEKFTLVRYGGLEESRQLRDSYYSRLDVILGRSALAYQVRNLTREWKAKRVLGGDPHLGAIEREVFSVDMLIHHPEKNHIQAAWRITLTNVQSIFDYCQARGIPLLLVIHPFRMQFDAPGEMDLPQRKLTTYARAHGVHTVDLLPILNRHLDETDEFPAAIYVDHDHYSVEGHRVVAGVVADSLRTLLDGPR